MRETLHDFSAAIENLISVNREAEQGFRSAADAVADAELKRMYVELSGQRAGFASELQDAVRKLGFEPPNPLGAAGTLHGIWIKLKGAVTGHDRHAILEETERGEDHSLNTYREGLGLILQPDLRALVERQLASIQASHNQIRTLRDRTAPPPDPQRTNP